MRLSKNGISLIEAVLTIFVLSIAFVSSIQAVQEITASLNFSDKEIIATQLAAEKLEAIMADKKSRGFAYITNANYPDETLGVPYTGHVRKTNIVWVNPQNLNTPASPPQILKRVQVVVEYGNSDTDSISLTGLVGDY